MIEKFDGEATIKIRFQYQPQYVRFREEILRTKWVPGDAWPHWEEMVIPFHNVEDLEMVTKTVVMLLQHGFEVYSTRYKLESQLAEEEYPPEGDTDGDAVSDDWDWNDELGRLIERAFIFRGD